MSDKLMDILKKSRLFAGFTKEQLEQVILNLQPKIIKLKSGERVYKRGEKAVSCWLIHSGNLTVQRASLRSPFRKMLYHEGSVTGIQGLVDPGSKRPVTMIAEDKVKLIKITHDDINKLDKKTQIQLWHNVSRLLLGKLAVCFAKRSFDD